MAAVRLLLLLLLSLSLTPFSLSISDTDALLKFKNSFTNADALNSWALNSSPCDPKAQWVGVLCFEGIITGLHLAKMGLSGKIDVGALRDLRGLRFIGIENNSFSGSIPEFNLLGSLKAIYISSNKFSGEIPPDFFSKMGSLKKLWISGNKFSGKIPESIGKLSHLMELHLEYNEFSGPIPSMGQPSVISIDLSNNKLEGEIPKSLSKFDQRSFQGNPGLCGKQLGKECKKEDPLSPPQIPTQESKPDPPKDSKPSQASWVILGVVIALLILVVFFKVKRKEDKFDMLRKEHMDEVVQVHIPSSNRRSMSSSRKGNDSTHLARRGSNRGKSLGDLVVVNEEKGQFGLADLMKAAAEVLGNGGLGSAYKAVMANGVAVVVKRLREMNKLSRDAFDTEMRRLGRVRHQNILTPLAYHYKKEEKLLVSEYVPKGSLLYILHGDGGISHSELNWPNRLKIIQGVARGMGFLHSEFSSYELPHGNLKSSNVLISSTYEPLLTDYAFHPLINTTHAAQSMFAYKSPEAIIHQQVSPKSDVYCLGILILEILTGKFPSQYLNNQKGGIDVVQWIRSAVSEKRESELIDPEIAGAADSLGQMEKLLHIGAACTESGHDQRIDMKEALRRIEEIQV